MRLQIVHPMLGLACVVCVFQLLVCGQPACGQWLPNLAVESPSPLEYKLAMKDAASSSQYHLDSIRCRLKNRLARYTFRRAIAPKSQPVSSCIFRRVHARKLPARGSLFLSDSKCCTRRHTESAIAFLWNIECRRRLLCCIICDRNTTSTRIVFTWSGSPVVLDWR